MYCPQLVYIYNSNNIATVFDVSGKFLTWQILFSVLKLLEKIISHHAHKQINPFYNNDCYETYEWWIVIKTKKKLNN